MKRLLCYVVAAMVAWTPFQLSHAGMIGTGDQIGVSTSTADRTAVLNLIERADIAKELTSFGVDPADAQGRIAAMSDAEVASLKGQLENAPAGGILVLILVVVILILVLPR